MGDKLEDKSCIDCRFGNEEKQISSFDNRIGCDSYRCLVDKNTANDCKYYGARK